MKLDRRAILVNSGGMGYSNRREVREKLGLFLTFLLFLEAWWDIISIFNLSKLAKEIYKIQIFYYINFISHIVIPLASLIALIGIYYLKRWSVYLLFIAFGYLFVETLIGTLLASQNLIGLPVFIILSLLYDGSWFWAIYRKRSYFQ